MAYSNNNPGYCYSSPPPPPLYNTRGPAPMPPPAPMNSYFPPPQVHIQYNNVSYHPNPPPQSYGNDQFPMQNQSSGQFGYSPQYPSGNAAAASVPPLPPPPPPPPELAQYTSFDTIHRAPVPPFTSPRPAPASTRMGLPNHTPNSSSVPAQSYAQQPSSYPLPENTTPAYPHYPNSYPSYYPAQSVPHQAALATASEQYDWAKSTEDAQAKGARIQAAARGELPFVAVPVNPQELSRISESVQVPSAEAGKPHAIKLMEANGFIEPSLPIELKQLFEPLYCQLCTISLSSNVVARDHYVGKKHNKKIEQWLQDHHVDHVPSNSRGPTGANAMPVGLRQISGTVKDAATAFKEQKRETIKRCFDGISGSSRPANEPLSKKSKQYPVKKKTAGGGPNFGFCEVCKVTLTSQVNADQHYSGKNHMTKLKTYNGDFRDRTFGIGNSFRRPPKAETNTQSGSAAHNSKEV